MTSKDSNSNGLPISPLLLLPLEVRLMIYEYLLFPSARPSSGGGTSIANLVPDFHTYYSEDTNNDPFTLSVRSIDPWIGGGSKSWRRRSTYYVRTGHFLTSLTPTTYRVLLSPYTAHLRHTIPSLLSLNHQIHAEASKTLYSNYTFSFHTTIEAIVPFLSDLTPIARHSVRHLSLTMKALPYAKEFDRAEWESACSFLAGTSPTSSGNGGAALMQPGQLSSLHLSVVAGKPHGGWDDILPIAAADFSSMVRVKSEEDGAVAGVDLQWAEQLMGIKGLREVSVHALFEHCARPVSEKIAFWIAFSKSVVEGGFGEWIRGGMVGEV